MSSADRMKQFGTLVNALSLSNDGLYDEALSNVRRGWAGTYAVLYPHKPWLLVITSTGAVSPGYGYHQATCVTRNFDWELNRWRSVAISTSRMYNFSMRSFFLHPGGRIEELEGEEASAMAKELDEVDRKERRAREMQNTQDAR
jgi:hypothetical protein